MLIAIWKLMSKIEEYNNPYNYTPTNFHERRQPKPMSQTKQRNINRHTIFSKKNTSQAITKKVSPKKFSIRGQKLRDSSDLLRTKLLY